MQIKAARELLESIKALQPLYERPAKREMEGGCGVVGLTCNERIAGLHIMQALVQMRNRGNSKGGGIAAFGLDPEQMRVSAEILAKDYLLQIAYLDGTVRLQVEEEFIHPVLHVDESYPVETVNDYRDIDGLDIQPPEVWRYFCSVREEQLDAFAKANNLTAHDEQRNEFACGNNLTAMERHKIEDEFIYQNSYRLNRKYYASLGEKRAFVLSHGRDMIILKLVGYAEQAIQYYRHEDIKANIWVGHQRYPTKGKVWHPGGAHPFIGLDEALIHNGDFANYFSVAEYLSQRNYYPLFLTDTEVAVLLFDLLNRVYEYPLEYIIEAMAPTTERDFCQLPEEKQKVYRAIQSAHIHGSPDGPWFFIIGRTNVREQSHQLIGITDTSMLRPQVFALQEHNGSSIALIASEKQAIDATLRSLYNDDARFMPYADVYWNARGGSHTDGGAFVFTLKSGELTVTDKFGKRISTRGTGFEDSEKGFKDSRIRGFEGSDERNVSSGNVIMGNEIDCRVERFVRSLDEYREKISVNEGNEIAEQIEELTRTIDWRWTYPVHERARILTEAEHELNALLCSIAGIENIGYRYADWQKKDTLFVPQNSEQTLVINCEAFAPEGDQSVAQYIVKAYRRGWKRFITFNWRGQRFCGCGLGAGSKDVRIDVYGSSGDYLGSGLDGASIYVHESVQDQVGQIMQSGKLVVYGDAGQTFMYGAKGGEVYVLGNAAGRPLINAVGRPRVVINGTCLDYLAESFMAGDPLNGGGFVIINGLEYDHEGQLVELDTPYPGGNLFSLASGGAVYIRDPHHCVTEDQLHGGKFVPFTDADCALIMPYLEENERLFGIQPTLGIYRKLGIVP